MKQCFECEKTEDQIEIHNHHVIPKSKGGIKTVPLCCECHGLVHGKKMMNMGNLIKKALKERKEKGLPVSHPPYGFQVGADGYLVEEPTEHQTWNRVMEIRSEPIHSGLSSRGLSWRLVAIGLNEEGYTNRSGNPWTSQNLFQINKWRRLNVKISQNKKTQICDPLNYL